MKKFRYILLVLLFAVSACSDGGAKEEEIKELKMELAAKEDILQKMEKDIERIVSNAKPRCEGGTVSVTVDEAPLEELRSDIEGLR